ncbi:MAG TPA: SH3 domain-containing protein [Gemmataceae bacterium]|nr:SH3 domain-containing protein [Gemmataceae bacterium]
MVGVILIAVATSGPLVSRAHEAEEAFAEAVRQRDDADKARPLFRKSADLFEELRRAGAANPALFRDEGNARLLAGDLPGAILAYRRGLRLAPDDRALQRLLAAAREQVVYKQSGAFGRPPVSLLPPWLPRLPARGVLLLACAAYAFGWVSLARWRMVRRGKWLTAALASFAVAALLGLALGAGEARERDLDARPLAVVAQDGVLLRKGNGLAYPRRYETPLNRGVEARLLFERGDWVLIELSGGETGWVPRAYVLIDRAPTGGSANRR